MKPRVLFLCTHNAGRSQMAAAFMRRLGQGAVEVFSGGTEPAAGLHPAAIAAMGCGDACPVVPGKRYIDWDLPNPAGLPLEGVRPIRDEIERRRNELLEELQPDNAEGRG